MNKQPSINRHQSTGMKFAGWSLVPALSIALGWTHPGVAQSLLIEQATRVGQINDQRPITDGPAIATDATPSPERFTLPSLWWQQQQQGEAINSRLIDSWRAYDDPAHPRHVDVIVNGQIWPLLSYLEQYAFITQFGESAKSYGYQLRIFTGERLVGLHVCDFVDDINGNRQSEHGPEGTSPETLAPECLVNLDYFGQGAIRGGRQR
ncbi:hypothetical protein [Leptothoe sp. PORK10 BA2]|jgi:hypothetical protein|uniref:hypothetical protein n=1 Tax=Leptothoe sp. PORK10 BA2 TaxID=3110254 RepID=UPI002B1EB43F|nr:hypothetical protein [Leptothoe sp. PORK10 BA2]MEA5462249.1 hypothetical protein [Leptothoe sp. PORK10 BA2]